MLTSEILVIAIDYETPS